MISAGFLLRRIALSGPDVPVAEIDLKPGLNVISGPSDTGKTYISQCINFMLGAGKSPKAIPESVGYNLVSVTLEEYANGRIHVLERFLKGGNVTVRSENSTRNLGGKHDGAKASTISGFLLDLSGLLGRDVLSSKTTGTVRPLSFRDLSRLILIDEESIIKERSPLLTGQYTTDTVEASVFRLLVTGRDDSDVVPVEDSKTLRTRRHARIDVIDEILVQARAEFNGLMLTVAGLDDELATAERVAEAAIAEIDAHQENLSGIEYGRREALKALRRVQSRLDVLAELQQRFILLEDQYASDLRRLEAISEAGVRLGQMLEERCPICGASPAHHAADHQRATAAPEDVVIACRAEAQNIRSLISDLHGTIDENGREIAALEIEAGELRAISAQTSEEIQSRLQPVLRIAVQRLQSAQKEAERLRRGRDLYNHISELEGMRAKALAQPVAPKPEGVNTTINADILGNFADEAEKLLREWHFPNLTTVAFSEVDQDLLISGRLRSTHGKGVRAITHAAFNLALLKHCESLQMPHPGFVSLDSPLVVYRAPDESERGFNPDVKDEFYRSLAKRFANLQVVVFENEDPPSDIGAVAHLIRFTKTVIGRSGFIPQ